jgi:hypothetical protein
MTDSVSRPIAAALSGRVRRPTHAVVGVNGRGEAFRIARYFDRYDAEAFRAEVTANGGTARVERIGK